MNNQLEPYRDDDYNSNYKKGEAYLRAKKKVEELTGFYWHIAVYIIVIPFLILINWWTFWGFKWFWFPVFGWGIGLTLHAFSVFGVGKRWEEEKIQQFMQKEQDDLNF
ncbi:histidine kinase [Flavobacteriaceae bacterium AU392]|nr:histidine kinase [Flavobacteriaceae bacterium]RKM83615.1 histidine kinase [Flavobacteriaceae bacterium AU392]